MVTLQKFKLLATQCAFSGSPTRSPVMHLRRRKTLRMLLTRRSETQSQPADMKEKQNPDAVRLKLKDFLLSSSPPHTHTHTPPERVAERVLVPRGGGRRPFTATLRQRLLRKSWRPVLVSISE